MTVREYPRIVVSPPGPKGQAIIARDAAWTSTSYIKEYPLVMAGGSGAMAEDVDGNRYIDFMAGIAVTSTGYNHPRVVAGHPRRRRAIPPHLRHRFLLRRLRPPGGAAGPLPARQQEAGVSDELGHRGGRGCDQAGAIPYPPASPHRFPRLVPRSQLRGDESHVEQGKTAGAFRAVPAGSVPRAVPEPVPLRRVRRRDRMRSARGRRHRGAVCPAAAPRRRRRRLRRTDPGRGWLRRATRPGSSGRCASCAIVTASCSSPMRYRAGSDEPERPGPASGTGSSPTSWSPPRGLVRACLSGR